MSPKCYFNPRSHEGSDNIFPDLASSSVRISIHAPTRGATCSTGPSAQIRVISIHAPTRGATLPDAPQRCCRQISIHAPTRGATRFLACRFSLRIFQSTLPRGERLPELSSPRENCNFNPRSHEGSDRAWDAGLRSSSHFNPRSHEGSDSTLRTLRYHRTISIHAPTRGATCFRCILRWPPTPDFNPRSHEGSDDNADIVVIEFGTFQSTLPRGERPVPDAA